MKQVELEGGTPRGVGFWSKTLGLCGRLAELEEIGPTPDYLLTGSIGHTMLAEWYRSEGQIQLRDYRIKGISVASPEYQEAARCFRAYIRAFPKPHKRFGKVVGVEQIRWPIPKLLSIKPDLITAKNTAPDHKFVAQITPEIVAHYLDSINAVVYLIGGGFDALIYNFISKEADPSFARVERTKRPDDQARYDAFVRLVRSTPPGLANPTACHRWVAGRPVECQFFGRGCRGY